MQWHPLFAYLLRLLIGDFYEVDVEAPVGDLPRRADVVLLRRTGSAKAPFVGLWSHLREWNVLEFKGPTDHPEEVDLELLMHVGTGIALRFNEERQRRGYRPLPSSQVALWYFTTSLGDPFLEAARNRAFLRYEGDGLWVGQGWGHPLFLVSYRDLPMEPDSVPLHLLRRPDDRPPAALADLMARHTDLVGRYGAWIATFHSQLWKEMGKMANLVPPGWIDWHKVVENVDVGPLIQAIDPEQVVQVWGIEHAVEVVGLERVIEVVGLERVIEVVGLERVIAAVGVERLLERMNAKQAIAFLAKRMGPADRQELRALFDDQEPGGE